MKRSEAIKEITNFINHYDGGNIQPYVTDKLLVFLQEELGFLPPRIRKYNEIFQDTVSVYEWEDE